MRNSATSRAVKPPEASQRSKVTGDRNLPPSRGRATFRSTAGQEIAPLVECVNLGGCVKYDDEAEARSCLCAASQCTDWLRREREREGEGGRESERRGEDSETM